MDGKPARHHRSLAARLDGATAVTRFPAIPPVALAAVSRLQHSARKGGEGSFAAQSMKVGFLLDGIKLQKG